VGARLDATAPAEIAADSREDDDDSDDRAEDRPTALLHHLRGGRRELGQFVILQVVTFSSLHTRVSPWPRPGHSVSGLLATPVAA